MTDPLIPPRKPKEVAKDCPMNLHLSGVDGGGLGQTYWPWPYRMNRADESGVSDTYVDSTDVFILDSAIDDPSVTNDDVIADAERYDVDYVIAADVLHDPEETTDRVLSFMDMLDDADTDAKTIVPLQPSSENAADHGDHYRELEGLADYYAVGGVKDASPDVKRQSALSVREVAGNDVMLHGFGFGIGYFQHKEVLKEPILDSIDCTTPIQQARKGEMYVYENKGLVRKEYPRPSGEHVLLQQALMSGTTLVSLSRLLMADDPEPADLRGKGQTGLEGFARPAVADGGDEQECENETSDNA